MTDDLLDVGKKLVDIDTLAANKLALLEDRMLDSLVGQVTSSSRPFSNSITGCSNSKTLRSDLSQYVLARVTYCLLFRTRSELAC